MESTSQKIKVEQSQSDRSKKPFHPVKWVQVSNLNYPATLLSGHARFTANTACQQIEALFTRNENEARISTKIPTESSC